MPFTVSDQTLLTATARTSPRNSDAETKDFLLVGRRLQRHRDARGGGGVETASGWEKEHRRLVGKTAVKVNGKMFLQTTCEVCTNGAAELFSPRRVISRERGSRVARTYRFHSGGSLVVSGGELLHKHNSLSEAN